LAVEDASVAAYAVQQRGVFSSSETAQSEDGVAASVALYFSFLQKKPKVFVVTKNSGAWGICWFYGDTRFSSF
jgi:hypothetical protein